MKNIYGTTPITIYGQGAGMDEPAIARKEGGARSFTLGGARPPKARRSR